MTMRLTYVESGALRARADFEDRSMQDVARAAVREYVDRRGLGRSVDDALDILEPRYRDVLDRLGQ